MNTKSVLVVIIVLYFICHGLMAQEIQKSVVKEADGTVTETTVTKKQVPDTPNVPYCLSRGIVNIATCPLEIPRCMIYDNTVIPVIGLVGGVIEGAGMTVYRALSGTADIVALGFSGKGFHSERFPDFVWSSKWFPTTEQVIIEKTIIEKEKTPPAK